MGGANGGRKEDRPVDAPDQKAAVRLLIDWLQRDVGFAEIAAVGHRVVDGGRRYHQPERVTAELIGELRKLRSYDPDHMPGEIELIEAFREPRSGLTPGCVLRHRISSRHAPRRPDCADPAAVRGRRGPALWLPWTVVRISDGGTGPGRRRGGSRWPCHPGTPRRRGKPGGGPGGPFGRHDHGVHAGLRAGHGHAHGGPRSGPGPVPVTRRRNDGRPVRQPRESQVRPAGRLGNQLRRARSAGTAECRCPGGRGDRTVLLPGKEVDRRVRRRARRAGHTRVLRGDR